MDTEIFIRAIREYAAMHYQNARPESFVLKLNNGVAIEMSIPRASFADSNNGLDPAEILLLNLIPDFGSQGASSKEILKLSGFSENSISRVRKILKSLMAKRVIFKDDFGFRKVKPEN